MISPTFAHRVGGGVFMMNMTRPTRQMTNGMMTVSMVILLLTT
jgi:hypothetical protein